MPDALRFAPLQPLDMPSPPIILRSQPRVQLIPLTIRILELKLRHKMCQQQLNFCHQTRRHSLSRVVLRSVFKGPSCVLHRVELVPGYNQPALSEGENRWSGFLARFWVSGACCCVALTPLRRLWGRYYPARL